MIDNENSLGRYRMSNLSILDINIQNSDLKTITADMDLFSPLRIIIPSDLEISNSPRFPTLTASARQFVDALTQPKTREDLLCIAQDPEFKRRMRWALQLTQNEAVEDSGLEPTGVREYGFIGYLRLGSTPVAIRYSDIYRGEETSVDVLGQFGQDQKTPQGATQCVMAHTHPYVTFEPSPSPADIKVIKKHSQFSKGFVFAIGVKTPEEWRVLLLSALRTGSTADIDPDRLVFEVLRGILYGGLAEVYRNAGLNALLVNLETGIEVQLGSNPELFDLDTKTLSGLDQAQLGLIKSYNILNHICQAPADS